MKCNTCAFCGDKYSFPLPNELVAADPKSPFGKRLYCCCGNSELYQEDVTERKTVCSEYEEL